ncbi:MAG: hypothetical protein ACSHYA_12650 [Opitutaceae bacterium]
MFRKWPFFCPGYAMVWNNIAAQITLYNISESKREVVGVRQHIALLEDRIDLESLPENEIILIGGFYTAMSLAAEGVAPILPANSKRWYPIINPRSALYILETTMETKMNKALVEFRNTHAIDFEEFLEQTGQYWK